MRHVQMFSQTRSQTLFAAAALAVCMLLAAGVSRAQQPNQQAANQQPAQKPKPVQIVLSKMHALNQLEMQVGQMAWERGATEGARSFGERLFRDHRSADRKVTGLAQAMGVKLLPLPKLPRQPKKMMQMKKKVKQLKQQQGQKFNRMFLKMMVQSHQLAIQTLNQALGKLQSDQAGTLIRRVLPILGQHRTLAQHLQAQETGDQA